MWLRFCQTRLAEIKGIHFLGSMLASCLLVLINKACHSFCLGYLRPSLSQHMLLRQLSQYFSI